jgi:hypothetical protein
METDAVVLYPIAVPSKYKYQACRLMLLLFLLLLCLPITNVSHIGPWEGTLKIWCSMPLEGYMSLQITAHKSIERTSPAINSMADYCHRATLDPDGMLRQYKFPKTANNQFSQAWSVVDMEPQNMCQAATDVGTELVGLIVTAWWMTQTIRLHAYVHRSTRLSMKRGSIKATNLTSCHKALT